MFNRNCHPSSAHMASKLTQFISYLFGKKSELKDLQAKDGLLAKVVLDIHRKRTHSTLILAPLFSLKQIHAIDRDNAIESTEARINTLQAVKDKLLDYHELTSDILTEHLPSVSAIKVVKESDNSYIAFEGNGRLVALQTVFEPSDRIQIEVEEYHFKNRTKIVRRMNRVRKMNKLL